jgi:hypothetical protein
VAASTSATSPEASFNYRVDKLMLQWRENNRVDDVVNSMADWLRLNPGRQIIDIIEVPNVERHNDLRALVIISAGKD